MTPLLFLIPILAWLGFAKFWLKHHFSVKELAVQGAFSVVLIFGLFAISDSVQMGGDKLVNGAVTDMRPVKKSCPIGWVTYTDGHCTHYVTRSVKVGESCSTDSKGSRTCTPIYETQYNYIYAWERRYFVDSNVPKTFEISRTDPQGVNTPPRFASVRQGDPVVATKRYRNYIRPASASLFSEEKVEKVDVAYPKIHDYYRANRVIADDDVAWTQDLASWNQKIAELNRDLRETGANVIVVLTRKPESYATQLAYTWGGHNINDVVVTIGVGQDDVISWVDVRSWSQESLVNIRIKDAVLAAKAVDPQLINASIFEAVSESYREQDPEAFAYLKDDISLPTATIIIALLMIFVFTPGITYVFSKHVDWQ